MNKTALRQFASLARDKIKKGVKQRAFDFGITEKGISSIDELKDGLIINGKVFGPKELKQYNHLKNRLAYDGYEQVMDEAAYTWFNRIIALRFMEVNNYLPIRMRILSSETPGKTEPDALTHILELTEELGLDRELVFQLQDENKNEELYQYLLIKQCNKLGEIIPNVFEYISDDLALLLPKNLLQENSIIKDIIKLINEEDWKDVEIVGWLYQFYIAERKDTVFANLKKNKKIGKQDIPAATQLFTPRWIVEYMVDNSLGRLWLESHPNQDLQEKLNYYLADATQTEEVLQQLEDIKNPTLNVEEIQFLDPCCGSGHILVYAFEVFYHIYLSRGYAKREIPQLILEKNLFGLDIDRRAAQLATFALIMKARSYDSRLFSRKYTVHVHSIEESNELTEEDLYLFAKEDESLLNEVEKLTETFKDAKLYGSIIQVPEIDTQRIKEQMNYFKHDSELDIFTSSLVEYAFPILEDLLQQYQLLSRQYEIVVTNPPYMGAKGMDPKLSKYVKKNYPDEKSDLFAVFMKVTKKFTKENFYTATINQHSWMFLSSYEKLRQKLVNTETIINMIHLGTRAFEDIGGEVVQNTTFIVKKSAIPNYQAIYIRMVDILNAIKKQEAFEDKTLYFKAKQTSFKSIPGSPIAYWATQKSFDIFNYEKSFGDLLTTRAGMITGNNEIFIRLWHEISANKFGAEISDREAAVKGHKKWFPYSKGGNYRKWYGNNEYVVNWENDGIYMRNYQDETGKIPAHAFNLDYIFKENLTWNSLSSYKFSARYIEKGFLFDASGSFANTREEDPYYFLALLCSEVVFYFLSVMNPTLNFQKGNISNLPVIINYSFSEKINDIVKANINISKKDWDSFETSWDFKQHPFLTYPSNLIEESFASWASFAEKQFYQLKANEEELNRIFIDIYGLQDELTPEVEEKDVTVRKADQVRDVKSFLSYLVGLAFGRYSLDEEGLAYAGGDWRPEQYKQYQPDQDNVIPVTQEAFFEDDIVKKVEELIGLIYGEETVEENLSFIAETLGKKNNESSRYCIRRYFAKDFYKDHWKIYQKRPIYWMFSSGKRGAFKCLMYLHRYDKDTVARIRTDYVLQQSKTLDNLIALEQHVIDDADASRQAKAAAQKTIENYLKDKEEIVQYAEVLDHIAQQQIELDLDDGVKVNYEKFQQIEVIKDQAGKLTKQNLLEKI
ncbi:BREX-1 system adenine-specific DNA-methyltransferase PglX [Pisciglobus halotolerans]|uniref:BREX-1 system adenine-specific DNA-methyltransferase PglX n=1 Tax=Pisciglobus halotolerans TaxID=745365 RepID=UPI000B803896|nr:BREX-1 system adenine-specific DNA-methyltransferase PglX [Pisciglobus halotolerans]